MTNPAGPIKAAFLGLGVMGYPMAGHLVAAGHTVTVYNRTEAKAHAWVEQHGGAGAPSPAGAVGDADIVFVCVGNDDDVRSVVLGSPGGEDGALGHMAPGSLLVDHTTASAGLARELHAAAAAVGVGFVDAPISGGQSGAENGTLTVMCGGDQADFDRAAPVIAAYSQACTLIGGPGSGQLTKCVNQISIAGLVQALSEAINFGLRAGLDMDKVLATISQGAAGSWQMSNRGATMVAGKFDYGFAVEWMRKDLGICLAEGAAVGADLTVTELVDGYYAEVVEAGGARWDTSSLITRLLDGGGE
ncbi:MAG: NAD(P)-dependent oxidoreductase [Acidimicrobiales bacterium]|nr:NAD(P)-dependent oxidoreductase [Acidimicrobiales bacterium]